MPRNGRNPKPGRKADIAPVMPGGSTQGGIKTTAALASRLRRSFIAEHLLIYNLTQTEIVDALAEAGHINPKTGEPWSIGTVNRDVSMLRSEWEEKAAADYDLHVRTQLAKIHQAQRAAWASGDLDTFARFMEQEIKITGTGQRDMSNQNADPIGDGWDVYEVLSEVKGRIEERNRLLGKGSDIIEGELAD